MTDVDNVPDEGGSAAATAVAESMSTVGYAMFALLQQGPLNTVPSMTDFVAQLIADDDLHPVNTGTFDTETDDTFGAVEVNDDMNAITHGEPATVHASSALAPGAAPVADPETATPQHQPGYPQPKNPVGVVPEYTGNTTLKMLDEISFLDE